MKTVNLIQGSPEWHAHRAQHWNASDAPAMLGVSPYKSRAELLRERATGIGQEFDDATQRRFDEGHRSEALARKLAEQIIGEELYPVTGVNGRYSASFDGLTLLEDTAYEHKSLNDELRAAINPNNSINALPEYFRVQMEQQCMVSDAERVLFMASKWDAEGNLIEERHCWYYPDAELRARIVAGWEQFELDLAAYQPTQAEAKPVGKTPETLPSLRIEARGMVTASNLAEFKDHAMTVLGQINRTLQTDDDFANAEATVKWCSGVEDKLDAAKANVLAQMTDVDAVCRTLDDVAAETRRIRLELDKLVKAEKENRKTAIVQAGVTAIREHYTTINATLGQHAMQMNPSLQAELGATIKGLKTLTSMREKVDAAVATAKIAASLTAEKVRVNMGIVDEYPDHAGLVPDRVGLCATKAPDDLRNLITTRIAEHNKREADRIERERIANESKAVEAIAATPAPSGPAPIAGRAGTAPTATNTVLTPSNSVITLGDINAAIAPLSITAEGLASVGILSTGRSGAAKLYASRDLANACRILANRLMTHAEVKAA